MRLEKRSDLLESLGVYFMHACERVFRDAYTRLSLNGDITGKNRMLQQEQIEQLSQAVTKLAQDNAAYKTTIEVLARKVNELEEQTMRYLHAWHGMTEEY